MVMLKKWMLSKELPIVGVLALCIFAIWSAAWRGTLTHLGSLRASDALALFEDRLQDEIHRIEAAGRAAESIVLRNPLNESHSDGLETILPFLDHSGALTNLVLWRKDGRSATIMRTAQGWDLLLTRPGKTEQFFTLRGSDRVRMEQMPTASRPYLAQQRPWFRFGSSRSAPGWMPGRYTFWGSGIEGLSYVIPIRGKEGELLGIVSADVQLNVLQRFAKRLAASEAYKFTALFSDGTPVFTHHDPETDSGGGVTGQGGRTPSLRGYLQGFLRPDHIPIAAEHSGTFAGQGADFQVHTTTGALLPRVHLLFWVSLLATELLFAGFAWSMFHLHQGLLRPLLGLLRRRKRNTRTVGSSENAVVPGEELSDVWEISQIVKQVLSADQIESERDQLLRQLERIQRVESVGELAAGYVHDANNQLALALCQIDLCREAVGGRQVLTGFLEKAQSPITTCSELLQRLLAFSRKSSGQKASIDLNALCRSLGTLLGPALGNKVHLHLDLSPVLPTIFGDPIQLEQALTNILLNARDAMPAGGTIHLITLDSPAGPCIEVRDEGEGIPSEIHRHIFEPFFTTKGPEKGTGLGLFMVSCIMKAHGGRVELRPRPDRGACFQLCFPVPAELA
jgi:signal transduction histidine kinase